MTQQKIYLKDYKAPSFSVQSLNLDFILNEDVCRVMAKSHWLRLAPGPLELNGEDLKLVSIKLNGQTLTPADYQLSSEMLTISSVPDSFTLEVETELQPQNNTSLEGLYKSNGIFCTQ